jgi:hypothetical protein
MSKTDKTAPWWVAQKRGECSRSHCGYPCKHFSVSGTLGVIKRKMTRSERTSVRDAINRGVDPPVDQHKHRALWDVA